MRGKTVRDAPDAALHPYFRRGIVWCIWLCLMPLLGVAAIWLSAWLGYLFGIWLQGVAAVVVPLMLLPGAYLLAPQYKRTACGAVALMLLVVALLLLCPSHYPAWHSRAFQATYLPMRLFCLTSALLLMPLGWPACRWMAVRLSGLLLRGWRSLRKLQP